MNLYSLRLRPGQDLRQEILNFAKKNNIQAGSIVTCVGALEKFSLRMAGAKPDKQDIREYNSEHEIVSLVGTFSSEDCHLHIALSDKEGNVIGGHLREGSSVNPTAEIVIAEQSSVKYLRQFDPQTGFNELTIE